MTEQILLEYALNAAWQVPLVTATAWLLLRVARLGPLGEHRVWLAVLAVCVLLPTRGISPAPAVQPIAAVESDSLPLLLPGTTVGLQPAAAPQPEALPLAPAPAWHTRIATLHLSSTALRTGAWIYASVIMLALLRLTRGWLGASRLLNSSETCAMNEAEIRLWHEVASSLNVSRPQVRLSDAVTSPVVVGVFNPILLLPVKFSLCGEPERRAALCHELAHIRRRDCLIHALCQVAALPLIWHPLVETVQRKIARTREMVCDEIAARAMLSEVVYARCLLRLAQGMLGTAEPRLATEGLGLFQSNKLEERVMKLTEAKKTMSTRETWLRRTAGIAAMTTAIAAISMFHLSPVKAQDEPIKKLVDTNTITTTQTVTPQQLQAPAPPAPAPAPAPAPQEPAPATSPEARPAPPAPLPPLAEPPPPTPPVQSLHGEIIDDDHSVGIAHGNHATVTGRPGTHTHHWMGADGLPFTVVDNQAADLTPDQQRNYEADYQRKIAQADKDMDRARKMLDNSDFKSQIESIKSGEIAHQIAEAQKDVAEQTAKLNSPEFKAQIASITNGQIAKQLAEIHSEEFRLQTTKQIDEALVHINSAEFKKQIADAQRQSMQINSAEIQKQLADARRQLAEANKQLADQAAAMQKLQQPQPKQ